MLTPQEREQELRENKFHYAKQAYQAYAETTNNKNFMGKPMPTFEELSGQIREAWAAAVFVGIEIGRAWENLGK